MFLIFKKGDLNGNKRNALWDISSYRDKEFQEKEKKKKKYKRKREHGTIHSNAHKPTGYTPSPNIKIGQPKKEVVFYARIATTT